MSDIQQRILMKMRPADGQGVQSSSTPAGRSAHESQEIQAAPPANYQRSNASEILNSTPPEESPGAAKSRGRGVTPGRGKGRGRGQTRGRSRGRAKSLQAATFVLGCFELPRW